jgi:hypothetical protein
LPCSSDLLIRELPRARVRKSIPFFFVFSSMPGERSKFDVRCSSTQLSTGSFVRSVQAYGVLWAEAERISKTSIRTEFRWPAHPGICNQHHFGAVDVESDRRIEVVVNPRG